MHVRGVVVAAFAVGLSACGDGGGGDAPDAAPAAIDAAAAPDAGDCPPAYTLYVNRTAGTYVPGPEDSRTNTSGILQAETVLAPHEPPAGDWETTMACVERIWAPYAMAVTDQDPGDVPHLEVVVTAATSNAVIGQGNVGSVAPFSCGVIPNSISFVFAGTLGAANEKDICDQIAWLSVKVLGLDNVLGCPEVNSLTYCPEDRSFTDVDRECGEFEARTCCDMTSTTINTHQAVVELVGACP